MISAMCHVHLSAITSILVVLVHTYVVELLALQVPRNTGRTTIL